MQNISQKIQEMGRLNQEKLHGENKIFVIKNICIYIYCIKRQTINFLQNIISFNMTIYYNQNQLKEYTNISNHLSFFSTFKNTCAYKNLFKKHWRYQ